MAIVTNYPKLSTDWLRHELDPRLYREQGNILAETGNLPTGAVMAKITAGAVTAAAKSGGNTGNGTCVPDATTPLLAGGEARAPFTLTFTTLTNIRLEDKDGVVLGDFAIGGAATNTVTIAEGLKVVVTQGATVFAVGDSFKVSVAPGSGKWVLYDPTKLDGGQVPAGILLDARDASGESDVPGVFVTGNAEIVALGLTWGAAVDDATKKAAGLALLAKLGFKARQAA
jgi:hypothetical protein